MIKLKKIKKNKIFILPREDKNPYNFLIENGMDSDDLVSIIKNLTLNDYFDSIIDDKEDLEVFQ